MTRPVDGIREFWERHARRDPLWAVLSDPTKKDRGWDLRQFLETGAREISLLMYQLDDLHIVVSRQKALDFGCGVGRLTLALADFFDEVTGVDVSPTMIRLADRLNREPERVRYVLNLREDLAVFGDEEFDVVYTDIVLQHLEPGIARGYLIEFLRILRPGGLLVFQLPSHLRPAHEEIPAVKPMPDEAYRASVIAEGIPARPVEPSTEIVVHATVTNVSRYDWQQEECGPIRLGNHWLDGHGRTMLVQDDGRASLPRFLRSGDACHLALPIMTPSRAGQYQCELDVVHEGISWFADKGSAPLRWAVSVIEDREHGSAERNPDSASGTSGGVPGVPGAANAVPLPNLYEDLPQESEDAGEFPMHGLHRDTVIELLKSRGGTLLHLENDERCGREWVGYRYFVRKL